MKINIRPQKPFRIPVRLWAVAAAIAVVALPASVFAAKTFTDLDIADAVEDELFLDPAVVSRRIDIDVRNGIATLTGSVDNVLAKDRAEKIAETVKGVRSVVNRIDVMPSVLITDTAIRDNIRTALRQDPATESYEIGVTVKDNRVTLTGSVDSWREKELAGTVAKGVKGVKDVANLVGVDIKENRPDSEILPAIRKALRWNVLVDDALIDVSVTNGHVALSGIVGSAAEKRNAIVTAWMTGVKSVTADKLAVERWARDEDLRANKYTVKTDEAIEQAVKDAVRSDPRVDSRDVTADVENGAVTLRGAVESLKAKRAAAHDTANTVGVTQVDNRLRVRPLAYVADRRLERRVRDALIRDPYVERYQIDVSVINGVVTLRGQVDSYFEKAMADDAVSSVSGVIAVNNRLDVLAAYDPYVYDPYLDDWYVQDYAWFRFQPLGHTTRSDGDIKEDIKDELWWSPFVDADQVTVKVNDGTATLSGEVDSWTEFYAAGKNAFEGGAVRVVNELTVQ